MKRLTLPKLQVVIQFVLSIFINFILLTSPAVTSITGQLWRSVLALHSGDQKPSLTATVNNITWTWRPCCKSTLPLGQSQVINATVMAKIKEILFNGRKSHRVIFKGKGREWYLGLLISLFFFKSENYKSWVG